MYTFVLEWTPALTSPEPVHQASKAGEDKQADHDGDGHRGTIPHGIIFAGFMVSEILILTIGSLIPSLQAVVHLGNLPTKAILVLFSALVWVSGWTGL